MLSRSTFYYQPLGENAYNLALMRLVDEQFTKRPFYGVPRMTASLHRLGFGVNPKRVRRLMLVMGLEAIYPKPRLSSNGPGHPDLEAGDFQPGQGPAQGKGPVRGASEAGLASAGQKGRPAGGRAARSGIR